MSPDPRIRSVVVDLVPEAKVVKNRPHLDLDVPGGTERLVSTGARVLRANHDSAEWTILPDPEGNQFCVFPSPGQRRTGSSLDRRVTQPASPTSEPRTSLAREYMMKWLSPS